MKAIIREAPLKISEDYLRCEVMDVPELFSYSSKRNLKLSDTEAFWIVNKSTCSGAIASTVKFFSGASSRFIRTVREFGDVDIIIGDTVYEAGIKSVYELSDALNLWSFRAALSYCECESAKYWNERWFEKEPLILNNFH